jgi:hypothetical protein
MTDRIEQSRAHPDRFLLWAGVAFAVGVAVHGSDHLRRGMMTSPISIMAGGGVQTLLVAVAVVMVLTHQARAPQAAIVVGFGSAAVFSYAHLLPTFWPGYQDSFISLPHTNVTWFSWLSAVAEIGAGVVFGVAGIRATRAPLSRRHPGSSGAQVSATFPGTKDRR